MDLRRWMRDHVHDEDADLNDFVALYRVDSATLKNWLVGNCRESSAIEEYVRDYIQSYESRKRILAKFHLDALVVSRARVDERIQSASRLFFIDLENSLWPLMVFIHQLPNEVFAVFHTSPITINSPNVIQIPVFTKTREAADHAISMEAAMFDERYPKHIEFIIVSNDNFAREVVERIKLTRSCRRFGAYEAALAEFFVSRGCTQDVVREAATDKCPVGRLCAYLCYNQNPHRLEDCASLYFANLRTIIAGNGGSLLFSECGRRAPMPTRMKDRFKTARTILMIPQVQNMVGIYVSDVSAVLVKP